MEFSKETSLQFIDNRSYHFLESYTDEPRTVYENVFNLDSGQKQKIFDHLMWNAAIENRQYQYDFVNNNCATKIADLFDNQMGNEISYISDTINTSNSSIRKMLVPYMSISPWVKLFSFLMLGISCDKAISYKEKMFLPQHLQLCLKDEINKKTHSKLLQKTTVLFVSRAQSEKLVMYDKTLLIPLFLLLIIIGCTLQKQYKLVNFISLSLTGIIGIFLLVMWIATTHKVVQNNLNLLWALPWNLVLAIILFIHRKKRVKLLTTYCSLLDWWYVILLALSFFMPQPYHITIILSLLIISISLIYINNFIELE